MEVSVVGSQESLNARIRETLAAAGLDCPMSRIVSLERVEAHLAKTSPGAIVVTTGASVATAVTTVGRLRSLYRGPLFAVGPVSEPKLVLGVLRGGASDFIDEAEVESDLPEAFKRLESARDERTDAGRLVAVVAPSGGSGASLVAVNLAVAEAKSHGSCLLIDLKPRNGDLAALLDLKPSHTIMDLSSIVDRVDRTLLEQTLAKHESGVQLLSAPRNFDAAFPPSAEFLEMILELGRALFPRLVVDVDPALGDGVLSVLRQADVVVMVMRLEFNSLRNARSMLEHLERQGIDPARIALVGNRKGQPREIPTGTIEEALGKKFAATLPDETKTALGAQNNGRPIVREYPRSGLARKLVELAKSLDKVSAAVPPSSRSRPML